MGQAITADDLLEQLVTLIEPKLEARGFERRGAPAGGGAAGPEWDEEACRRLVSPEHLGDSVLERAQVFFSALVGEGEIGSLELVEALGLKGPTSIPANLTNPLKKGARRLGLADPWEWAEDEDGGRTVWRDRDGIAARMMHAIAAEKERRGGGRS